MILHCFTCWRVPSHHQLGMMINVTDDYDENDDVSKCLPASDRPALSRLVFPRTARWLVQAWLQTHNCCPIYHMYLFRFAQFQTNSLWICLIKRSHVILFSFCKLFLMLASLHCSPIINHYVLQMNLASCLHVSEPDLLKWMGLFECDGRHLRHHLRMSPDICTFLNPMLHTVNKIK